MVEPQGGEEVTFEALVASFEEPTAEYGAKAGGVNPDFARTEACWGTQILGDDSWCVPGFVVGKCHFKCVLASPTRSNTLLSRTRFDGGCF